MEWIDYREKLGIGYSDKQQLGYFMTKMFNVLDTLGDSRDLLISDSEYLKFCNITGVPVSEDYFRKNGYWLIVSVLRECRVNFKEFIAHYIAFINCRDDSKNKKYSKTYFKDVLCQMLKESNIPYELIEEDGGFFVFPKGAKELDDALVSEVLFWLDDYPLSKKAWISALKDYSESVDSTASETADKFRKALERFFQEFFESDKSLENLKSEYGTFLTSKGIPSELKNNFEKLLEAYTKYINNYAKHHDKTSKNVLEYIMYQTGNIMRLLITLRKD